MKTRLAPWLIAGLCMSLLTACSKTVTWEEEVPLNTGETIWVTRIVTYSLQGGAGNPLDMAYRPEWTETLEFNWQGKNYSYTGDADVMLLAISPLSNSPVLVANAALKNWDTKNSYRCTTPYYVQLSPTSDREHWIWPSSIESWLYDRPANLMLYRPKVNLVAPKYSKTDRERFDSGNSSFLRIIKRDFAFTSCKN